MKSSTKVSTRSRLFRDLGLLVLIVVVLAMPFLWLPFHMDDNFYMDMARNTRHKPLHPHDTPYIFEGKYLPDVGSHSHPPLQTYFLALLQYLVGEGRRKEWIYHSAALVFPVSAVIAFYLLSARFLERPLWPALMLACSPTFMVMQHTLMTDVPLLAYWLAAIATFIWATDRGNQRGCIASSVFQFAAMFTSYQALALTPLLGFYQFRKRGRTCGWLAVLVPPAVLLAWLVFTCIHYRRLVLLDIASYIQSRDAWSLSKLATKLAALLQYQGWLIVFPIFLLYIFGRKIGALLSFVGLIIACAAHLGLPHYRVVDKAILTVGLLTGLSVMLRMTLLLRPAKARVGSYWGTDTIQRQFIVLWYFGVAAYCMLLFTDGSARYTLPLIPPVLLLFCHQIEACDKPALKPTAVARSAIVATLACGLALSHADLEFAGIYPRAAHDFSRMADGMEAYYGGEWGFRYYFAQSGVRQLPADSAYLSGGSWVVRPNLATPYEVNESLLRMTVPVQPLTYQVTNPLRLLDWKSPAGFYSTYWGKLPFSLSFDTLEAIEIRQVQYLVERLPWAKIEGAAQGPPRSGHVFISGESPLALLLMPGTRVSYPWTGPDPLILKLKCAVSPEAYSDGDDSSFDFAINQRDGKGNALASVRMTLRPGMQTEDRQWQPVQLPLQTRGQGTVYLELHYDSTSQSTAIGAFAEALLWPAPRTRP